MRPPRKEVQVETDASLNERERNFIPAGETRTPKPTCNIIRYMRLVIVDDVKNPRQTAPACWILRIA